MKALTATLEILYKITEVATNLFMAILFVIVNLGVFSRYLFLAPFVWTEELALFLLVWMVFLAGSLTIRRWENVRVTFFIEKLPFNFLYLGFIAKAFPAARLVHLRRHAMDACFAMYKQMFTWAYKFSYSLEALGADYVAHERLARHWRSLLGERLVEVEYETLVSYQEAQTRWLLGRLGLEFEPACL